MRDLIIWSLKEKEEKGTDKFYFLLLFNNNKIKSQGNILQTWKACLANLYVQSKEPWYNYWLQPQ